MGAYVLVNGRSRTRDRHLRSRRDRGTQDQDCCFNRRNWSTGWDWRFDLKLATDETLARVNQMIFRLVFKYRVVEYGSEQLGRSV